MRRVLAAVLLMRSWRGGYSILIHVLLIFSIPYFLFVPKIMASTAENPIKNFAGPPRQGPFANNPGKYQLAVRAVNQIVNPGGSVHFEVYITGYGEITVAKLFSTFPKDIIEIGDSTYFTHTIGTDNSGIFFGSRKDNIDDAGIIIDLVGIKKDEWDYSTMFIDYNLLPYKNRSPLFQTKKLLTESKINKSMLEYHLKTINDAIPGIYVFNFYLTYFNGSEWNVSTEKVQIEIPTLLKRNEITVWIFGSILALIATFSNIINIYKCYKNKNRKIVYKNGNGI